MKSSLGLAVLLLLVSCSKVKHAEETMDKMSGNTENLKAVSTIMYEQMRADAAEKKRAEKFEEVLDVNVDMGSKISAAAIYFKAFEFQLWTSIKSFDHKKAREHFFLDAANEFTRRMCDLYDKIDVSKMSPTNLGDKHNDEMAFYAIATTMHMNHSFQEKVGGRKHRGIYSMYDLIKVALRKDAGGEELLPHEEVLLTGINKEIMTELIKARVDMLSALALKHLTDKRKMSKGQKLKALAFKLTRGKLGSIQVPETFDVANDATKETVETYLDGAIKAKEFLAQLGIEKDLEKTIQSAYKHIDLTEIQVADDSQEQEAGDEQEDGNGDLNKASRDQRKEHIRGMINSLLNKEST